MVVNLQNGLHCATEICILPGMNERIRPALSIPHDGSCSVHVHHRLTSNAIVHEPKHCGRKYGQQIYSWDKSHHLNNFPVHYTRGRIRCSSIRGGCCCWCYLLWQPFLMLPCHRSDHTVANEKAGNWTDALWDINGIIHHRVNYDDESTRHSVDQTVELQQDYGRGGDDINPEDCYYLENARNRHPIVVVQGFADVQAGIDTDTKNDPHVATYANHIHDFYCKAEVGLASVTNVVHRCYREKLTTPSQKVSDAEVCH